MENKATNFQDLATGSSKGEVVVENKLQLANICREFFKGQGYIVIVTDNWMDTLKNVKEYPA